jgi:hypothetical protein
MRTPDRPGATIKVLQSLRTSLEMQAPGALRGQDWNVRYARVLVASGNVALIQLTAQFAVDPDMPLATGKSISQWGPAELSMIERHALEGAADNRPVTPGSPVNDTDLPENTVISVDLLKMPDLDRAAEVTKDALQERLYRP